MNKDKSNIILEVKGLKKYFPLNVNIFGKPQAYLKAVDDVSFTLEKGKTIGVVGESGCGKTTLGRTILQLYDTTGGKSLYYGHSLEEFLPKYYVKEIANLPTYANKFNNIYAKLQNLLSHDEISIETITITKINELIEKTKNELNSLTKDNSLFENKKTLLKELQSLCELLNTAKCSTGALLLGDAVAGKQLLLNKVNKEHELALVIKKREAISKRIEKTKQDKDLELPLEISKISEEIEILKIDLDKCINDLENHKNTISHTPLYNELEDGIETGLDLAKLTKSELRSLRTEIQLIFQDPYSSLPPRMTIGQILKEPVSVHGIVEKEHISEHVRNIMKMCGLQMQYYSRYPHEFSGGQRQRICIARALVVNPKLVICDEPVSALDVSIQAQIINLLKDLQKQLGLTYMFISHDLSVVKYITDDIIVMYLGNMMEIGDTKTIFDNPLHPYTKALFSAVPVPDPDAKMNRIILKGDIPSPANPPKGCKFHTRCEKCMSVCKLKTPSFIEVEDNHLVACHLYNQEIMEHLDIYDLELKQKEELSTNEKK